MKNSIIFILAIIAYPCYSQITYKSIDDSEITVMGSSTLHDWEMKTDKVEGEGTFLTEGSAIKGVPALRLTIQSEDLKSGKTGMDEKAYEALNTKKEKSINFSLKDIESITYLNGENKIKGNGDLKINSVVNRIPVEVDCKVINEKISCTGNYSLKMTEYNVTPPTAMLGTIKTGDDLALSFNLTFTK